MADTIFNLKDHKRDTYLVDGSNWRYQIDKNNYVWDSEGTRKVGHLQEKYWRGERWFKVMVNGSQVGWVKK